MNAVQKLRQLVDEIKGSPDPFKKVDAWSLIGRLLGRTPGVNQAEVKRVIDAKDVAGLDAIVHGVEHPGAQKKPEPAYKAAAKEVTDEELRHAMKMFRKRLRLSRLSDESRLSGRYTSKGETSKIDAIIPPTEIPTAVWAALVEKGGLEYTGEGFYKLPGDPKRA